MAADDQDPKGPEDPAPDPPAPGDQGDGAAKEPEGGADDKTE